MEIKTEPYALEVQHIEKSFFGNHVLKDVTMGIKKGEVLGLVGSNGAGKSTLMKIINGVYRKDAGIIKIDGVQVDYKDQNDAKKNRVAMVYQEFSVIPTMMVYENIFLGIEPKKNGLIDDKRCKAEAENAFKSFGVEMNVEASLDSLSTGNQQIVEIVKAMIQKPAILILDEPTASLTHKEIDLLFLFIQKLKDSGVAVLMISHHMSEIMKICDRVVVLRSGALVLDAEIGKTSIPEMVQAMIGRKLEDNVYLPSAYSGDKKEALLSVKNIHVGKRISDVSFEVYPGEILGIAGLLGSGRTELLKAIYGLMDPESGQVLIHGQPAIKGKPWMQIDQGVFFVPENRRESGIVGIHTVHENMNLPIWKRFTKKGLIDDKETRQSALAMKVRLNLKATSIDQEVERLSGGNQQKVVFAKSLLTKPTVLLLDEPTVGIDVEAKSEVALLIRDISNLGNAVVLISSEMDEMARLCDRVLILKQGKVRGILDRSQGHNITEHSLSEAIQQ